MRGCGEDGKVRVRSSVGADREKVSGVGFVKGIGRRFESGSKSGGIVKV